MFHRQVSKQQALVRFRRQEIQALQQQMARGAAGWEHNGRAGRRLGRWDGFMENNNCSWENHHCSWENSLFFMGKSQFFMGKSPCFMGKFTISMVIFHDSIVAAWWFGTFGLFFH